MHPGLPVVEDAFVELGRGRSEVKEDPTLWHAGCADIFPVSPPF